LFEVSARSEGSVVAVHGRIKDVVCYCRNWYRDWSDWGLVGCFGQVVNGYNSCIGGIQKLNALLPGWPIFEKVIVYMVSSITNPHAVVDSMVRCSSSVEFRVTDLL